MRPNSTETVTVQLIAARLKSEWAVKLILLIVLNLWVYVPYLFLQHHHLFTATTMPLSFCDRLIPFCSQTVWIYLSIYFLMPIGPFLMDKREQILRYAIGIVSISVIADVVFLFWPTSCPRPDATGTNAVYQTLIGIDNPFHAFPSLHAAFAVYSARCGGMVMRELSESRLWQCGLWLWAFLILLATLTTKQHVIADILAGGVLGFGIYSVAFNEWKFVPIRKSTLPPTTANLTQPN